MLPALISAMLAIWRSVVAEYPCWRNSFAAASSTDCRDFSDFDASALSAEVFDLPESGRASGIDLRALEALRACLVFDLTGRSRLETSKPRRVEFIFKVLSSQTGATLRDKATAGEPRRNTRFAPLSEVWNSNRTEGVDRERPERARNPDCWVRPSARIRPPVGVSQMASCRSNVERPATCSRKLASSSRRSIPLEMNTILDR
jgi:hypothetical protein